MKKITSLLTALALFAVSSTSLATTSYCWDLIHDGGDGFQFETGTSNPATDTWFPWDAAPNGGMTFGNTSFARPNMWETAAVIFGFAPNDPPGSFMLVDKFVSGAGYMDYYHNPSPACSSVPRPQGSGSPPYKIGTDPVMCTVGVHVQTSTGISVFIQILDPDTYGVLGEFRTVLPASNSWAAVQVTHSTCKEDNVIRIGAVKTPGNSVKSMVIDDVYYHWYY